jgi:alcohol dehydrogenase (cytochrome c)
MKTFRHVVAALALLIPMSIFAQVPYERLLHSDHEPQNWLTYGGNLQSQRFSALKQINTKNAASLKTAWVYQMRSAGIVETSPIVVDGIMYITEPPSTVTALDARTGKALWRWTPVVPRDLVTVGLFPTNRGIAVLDDMVYVGTIDAYLVALDAKSGVVRWSTHVANNKDGYAITQAPLAIDGKIITGTGGSESGAPGFLAAYDPKTGKELWRLWTVPRSPSDPGADTWANDSWVNGGGDTWNGGSYDPELNTIYWGTGNPAPDWNGEGRLGDNLFTCALIAVDADTGKMKWYFQYSPHETHDWDAAEIPILFDSTINGKPRKLVAMANRNAFYYVLDRVTGEFLVGVPFAKQTWAEKLDAKGRPIKLPNTEPTVEGNLVYPTLSGATNWTSPSYSPLTGLFYVPTRESGAYYIKGELKMAPGNSVGVVGGGGGGGRWMGGDDTYGAIRALEATTGNRKWEFKMVGDSWTATLATAGGLVFSADTGGNFFALDAETGKLLWHTQLGGSSRSNSVTYAVDGKQYVAETAGVGLFVFSLP